MTKARVNADNASADIQGVTAGTGLTGGGTSGSVTLAIDSTVATLSGAQALTNKDLTGAGNTFPTSLATLSGTQTLSNKTIALGSNTVSGTTAQFNTALTDGDFATLAGSETLTNKTVALGSNTISGTLAQFNTALTDADFASIAGAETLTNKTVALGSNTVSGTLAQFNTALTDADFASIAGSETLTNKTLTSPTLNSALENNPILRSPEERWTVSAIAATGTINFDALTQGVLYYTTNASGNWTLNVRGDGSNTLNSALITGDSITVAFLAAQGGTAFRHTALTIDGAAQTVLWSGGTAPAAGNTSGTDAYSFTIIKTAATPTYTVLGAGPIKYA